VLPIRVITARARFAAIAHRVIKVRARFDAAAHRVSAALTRFFVASHRVNAARTRFFVAAHRVIKARARWFAVVALTQIAIAAADAGFSRTGAWGARSIMADGATAAGNWSIVGRWGL